MGLRFRRRLKICPGIYLNFSSGGASVTAGVRGASINVGPKGTYLNAGIPGTGISLRERISNGGNSSPQLGDASQLAPQNGGEIKSAEVESLTGIEFAETKEVIISTYRERQRLESELKKVKVWLFLCQALSIGSKMLVIGFVIAWFKNQVDNQRVQIQRLVELLADCRIDLDMVFNGESAKLFEEFAAAYKTMTGSSKIWDVTSSVATNRARERTSASSAVQRARVRFDFAELPALKSSQQSFHLGNANGPEVFIYPAFILFRDKSGAIGILGYKEIEVVCSNSQFIEEEGVPADSKQIGTTWKKANKNGGQDRRFKDNYQIPILLYGEFSIRSASGLHDSFMVSNNEATRKFVASFQKYQSAISQGN